MTTARGPGLDDALVGLLDGDDDVADLLAGLNVAVGVDDLVQRICSVDHRLELAGVDQTRKLRIIC